MNTIELLKQYKQLLDDEVITQEEFEQKRDQLLRQSDDFVGRTSKAVPPKENTTPATPVQNNQQNYTTDSSSSTGWAVLGFLIPLVGLILFLAWNTSRPNDAKAAGKGALIGFCVGILGYMLMMCAAASSYY